MRERPSDPTEALRSRVERRYQTEFWGRTYRIKPRLVDDVFGDGKLLLGIQPLNTRPSYYVVRADSGWNLDNCADGQTVGDHLNEVLSAIEDQFGMAWYDDDPPQRKSGRKFPALNDLVGCQWFEYADRGATHDRD